MTRLKLILMSKGVTGKWLAERSGMSKSSIYKYTSGNRKLSYKVAQGFAQILEVDVAEIMGVIHKE